MKFTNYHTQTTFTKYSVFSVVHDRALHDALATLCAIIADNRSELLLVLVDNMQKLNFMHRKCSLSLKPARHTHPSFLNLVYVMEQH